MFALRASATILKYGLDKGAGMGLAIFKGWMTGILGGIVVAVIWCLAIDKGKKEDKHD